MFKQWEQVRIQGRKMFTNTIVHTVGQVHTQDRKMFTNKICSHGGNRFMFRAGRCSQTKYVHTFTQWEQVHIQGRKMFTNTKYIHTVETGSHTMKV